MHSLQGNAVYYISWVNFTSDAKNIKHLHKVKGRIKSIWWITLSSSAPAWSVAVCSYDMVQILDPDTQSCCWHASQGPHLHSTKNLLCTTVALRPGWNALISHWWPSLLENFFLFVLERDLLFGLANNLRAGLHFFLHFGWPLGLEAFQNWKFWTWALGQQSAVFAPAAAGTEMCV